MSFLNPWLWMGAAAVGVPLWLHLRSRASRVFRFPTLRFLEDQPRPRTAGLRVRDALLLLVRTAAVLLLVAAFAWPYRDEGRRIVESRVHVFDNTFSRQAGDGWARDRDRIRDVLGRGGGEAQDAVIELASRPRVLVGFADDRAEAAQRLADLQPTFTRGSYLEALRLAQSMLTQSLGSRRRILVYADHQENQWSENEASPPFLEGVEVELVGAPASPAALPNLSLGEPSVRRFFLGEHAYVDLSAELRHDGPFHVARLQLRSNGQRILAQDLPLGAEPGLATLRGQWRSDAGAWLRGEIEIEKAGDSLAADDRVYFALPPVLEGRLSLLARSPYLRAALGPDTMKGRWATTLVDPAASHLADGPEELLPEVFVLEADYAASQQVRALALRCLNNGRGVVLFVRRVTPLVKGFLAELGLEASEAPPGEDAFRLVASEHPVFRPFLNGELGDILSPRVFHHVRLVSTQAAPLLFGTSGDALLLEGTATKGRLLVFAFGQDREQTDWPLQPSFVPFLDILLQHARQGTPIQTSAAPGEIVTHAVSAGRAAPREVVLRDDTRELVRAGVDDTRLARLEAPPRPGIYALTYDADPTVQALVAVNAKAKESVLRFAAGAAAVKAWTLSAEPRPAAAGTVLPSQLTALDQRLWWWCLWAGLAALALESGFLIWGRGKTA